MPPSGFTPSTCSQERLAEKRSTFDPVKRLADIAALTGEAFKKMKGLYQSAHRDSKLDDVSKVPCPEAFLSD